MPAQITTNSLVATAPHAGPTAHASFGTFVWRWLVLSGQMVAHRRRIARDAALLRDYPDFMLRDIGLDRSAIEQACQTGKPASSN